jgi:hypothetical protein
VSLVKVTFLIVLVLSGFAGCARQPETARHTVDEYRADKGLRQDVFKKCANDPGTLQNTPDCINANAAERLESLGSLRNSPPIGLDDKKQH